MKIKLGDTAKDTITGFKGIVIAITHWLNGCTRISIQPAKLKEDGTPIASDTFDEPQCALVKSNKRLVPVPIGGPSIKPVRNKDPR